MPRRFDLRSNQIDIETLGAIAEDVAPLRISGLQFKLHRFTLTMKPKFRMVKDDALDVYYSIRRYDETHHEVFASLVLRFFSKHYYCTVKIETSASARFSYEPYIEKLKGYLYTYMAGLIDHNDVLLRLKLIKLPDTIASFHPKEPRVYVVQDEAFSWKEDDSVTLSRIPIKEAMSEYLWPASYGITCEEDKPKNDLDNDEFLRHVADIRQREINARSNRA